MRLTEQNNSLAPVECRPQVKTTAQTHATCPTPRECKSLIGLVAMFMQVQLPIVVAARISLGRAGFQLVR